MQKYFGSQAIIFYIVFIFNLLTTEIEINEVKIIEQIMERIKRIIALGVLCSLSFGSVYAQQKSKDMKEEKVYYSDYDTRFYTSYLKDEQGNLVEIEDNGFIIEAKPQKVYKGVYKDGKPYDGYFKEGSVLNEIDLVNYYEKGELKGQYSYDYLAGDQSSAPFIYGLETLFEGGKVRSGRIYKEGEDRSIVEILNYEDFKVKSLFIDMFAMHYFNRFSFELTDEQLVIRDLQAQSAIEVEKQGDKLVADYLVKNKKLLTAKPFVEKVKKGTPLSQTLYYKDDKGMEQEFSYKPMLLDSNLKYLENSPFLAEIFLKFPNVYENSLADLLSGIIANFEARDEHDNQMKGFGDLLPLDLYPFKESQIVRVEEYDHKGHLVKE